MMSDRDPMAETHVTLEVKHRDGIWTITSDQIPGLYIGSMECGAPLDRQLKLHATLGDVVKAWEILAKVNQGVAKPPSQLTSVLPKVNK